MEFSLGGESFAVDLLLVKEVITPPEMTPIPKSPAHVSGLINLRGLVLTVVDARKLLGIQPEKATSENAVIIFDLGDRLVGVIVDSIQKVLHVPLENVKPVPDADAATPYMKGIIQFDNKLTMLIDPEILLAGTASAKYKAS
jgi:purine-binding chemotaxis protein CheW